MNGLQTLLGGRELTVIKADGTQEAVKVLQLGVHLCQKYADIVHLGDEEKEIEFLCAKEAGWAQTLSPQSQETIITAGDEVNADFFSRWQARRSKRAKALPKADMVEIVQMIEVLQRSNPALLDSIIAKSTSPTLSPKSPPPAA